MLKLIIYLVLLLLASSAFINAAPKPTFSLSRFLGNLPLYLPFTAVQDSEGNIWVTDSGNHVIRKVDTNNVASVFAGTTLGYSGDGGPPANIQMYSPAYIEFDTNGDMYWTEANNCIVRKYSKVDGIVSTIAGVALQCDSDTGDNGLATLANLKNPTGLAFNSNGDLLVATTLCIRKIDRNGIITTITFPNPPNQSAYTGDGGLASNARLTGPQQLIYHKPTGDIYWAEYGTNRVRKITASTNIISTVAGSDIYLGYSGDNGPATQAKLGAPYGLFVDTIGNIYFTEVWGKRIRLVSAVSGNISTIAGNGQDGYSGDGGDPLNAALGYVTGLTQLNDGSFVFASQFNGLRKLSATCSNGMVFNKNNGGCECPTGFKFTPDQSACEVICSWPNNAMNGPTPLVQSNVLSNGIEFSVKFARTDSSNIDHHMKIGAFNFNPSSCVLSGSNVPLKLTNTSSCTDSYTTGLISFDSLISNPSVSQLISGGMLKLTIPFSLHYLDTTGSNNGGFCQDSSFEFTQEVNLVINPVFSSFSNYMPFTQSFGIHIYPQQVSNTNNYLKVKLIVESDNATLHSFSFFNSTNPMYTLQLVDYQYLYSVGNAHYHQYQLTSNVAVTDYRALMYFSANVTLEQGIPENRIVYIPLNVDYQIIVQPTINATLQASVVLTDTNGQTQTKFTTNDKVNVNIQSTTSLSSNKLLVSDAWFCCFKQFTASISYNPAQGQYGCSKYDASSMEVWSNLISNSATSGNLQTVVNPSSGNTASFSFNLLSSVFPAKSSPYSTTCFIQANVGISSSARKISIISSLNEAEVDSMVVVNVPQGTKVVSQASSWTYSTLLVILIAFVMIFKY